MDFDIDFSRFHLKESDFDNHSWTHGINHTYRVMHHVLRIGMAENLNREVKLAFCAAYIHDLARKHDGYCDQHGEWAMKTKLPLFTFFFKEFGFTDSEIEIVGIAIRNHSERFELDQDDISYKVAALLKDADALDRIRIGENNLNPDYLRFMASHDIIEFAKKLYFKTQNIKISSFTEILKIAELINQ
jgi:hypothetical protein